MMPNKVILRSGAFLEPSLEPDSSCAAVVYSSSPGLASIGFFFLF